MKIPFRHLLTAVLLVTVPAACGGEKKDDKSEKKKKDDDDEKKGGGLDADGNDEGVVKLAKKILKCEWKNGSPPSSKDCESYDEWSKGELFKDGAMDDTLVNILEDEEANARYLAASALGSRGKKYREDKDLAKRVVKALEAEKEEAVAERIAGAAANIDLDKTGLVDDAIELMKKHASTKARARLIGSVMFHNRESTKLYDFVKDTAKSGDDEEVQSSAVSAFWTGTPRGKDDEVCQLWREIAEGSKAGKVADKAFKLAMQNPSKRCEKEYDALLGIADGKAKGGKIETGDIGYGLGYLAGQKDVKAPQKTRAIAIGKALVDNASNSGMARSAALQFLGEYDPGAKTIASKYKDDKEFFVKNTAKRILDGEITLKK